MDSNTNVKFTTSCTLPCKTCNSTSQPTVCTSCYSNTSLVSGQTILSGNSCTSFCPTGYYLDDTISTCLICSTSCLTCSAYTTCLSCNTSFLYNQSCLTTCPFGYYGFNAQCLACPTSIFCESCSSNY
jgi:proprotein convertase subtilisin/kexin type 5